MNNGKGNANYRHGHSPSGNPSPTYTSWDGMKQRCLNPNFGEYKDYGGRGIKVCERWMRFDNFLADMGKRPTGKSLDRFPDNNGNYEPGNCRWATPAEQNRNKRDNVFVEYNGYRLIVADWSKKIGINKRTIQWRLRVGYPIELVLSPKLLRMGRKSVLSMECKK